MKTGVPEEPKNLEFGKPKRFNRLESERVSLEDGEIDSGDESETERAANALESFLSQPPTDTDHEVQEAAQAPLMIDLPVEPARLEVDQEPLDWTEDDLEEGMLQLDEIQKLMDKTLVERSIKSREEYIPSPPKVLEPVPTYVPTPIVKLPARKVVLDHTVTVDSSETSEAPAATASVTKIGLPEWVGSVPEVFYRKPERIVRPQQKIGTTYDFLETDPRFAFRGAPSKYLTGRVARLCSQVRKQLSGCPTEVTFWPVGTAAIVKEERVELADGTKYSLKSTWIPHPEETVIEPNC